MFKNYAIGLVFLGLLGIGSAVNTQNAISQPLTFTKEYGFQKLFPNDNNDGSVFYYKPNSVKILNRRKKSISLAVYLKLRKEIGETTSTSYIWKDYIISCVDGTLQQTAQIHYNDQNEITFSSIKSKTPEEIPDDSDYGKLRDRLCKKFGF